MQSASSPTKPPQNPYDQQILSIMQTIRSRNKNQRIVDRLASIAQVLLAPQVDTQLLKFMCCNGLPEESGRLRVYCWMVLLGILPSDKSKWQNCIQSNAKNYEEFVTEFMNKKKYPNFPYGERYSKDLKEWPELQQDFMVWEQIEKDTMRTHSELSFFSGTYNCEEIPFYKTGGRKEKEKMIRGDGQHEEWLDTLDNRVYRYDIMTRILFIASKFNKQLKYVQGMNEILAPVFYICNSDSPVPRQAQTMSIFMKIASDIKQLHMKEFDKTEVGLEGKLSHIQKMLLVVDYELWARLRKLQITPFYYSFRWTTLYFGQQFELFDTLTLWDHIFTNEDRYKYMDIVCMAMLQCRREVVLKNDFTVALQYLQEVCDLNVREVIHKAKEIHQRFGNLDIDKEALLRKQTALKIDHKITVKKIQKGLEFLKNMFE